MNNKSYFFLFSFFALVIALNPSQAFAVAESGTQLEATLCITPFIK
jgi:hypothetical protein